MVTCNICVINKPLGDIQIGFRYVCKDCWELMLIGINGHELDKDLIY